MAEVRSKKGSGPSEEDAVLPGNISDSLRQQILTEKDAEKKNQLISLAWEEAGNSQESEFVSQKKKPAKPKPASNNAPNGGNAPRGTESKRTSNPARAGQERKPPARKTSGPQNGEKGAHDAKSIPHTSKQSPATTPATEAGAEAPSTAKSASTKNPAPVKEKTAEVKKAIPAAGPSQSAWASNKPLAKKLSEKPEEERRLAEERARAAEQKQIDLAKQQSMVDEERRRREAEKAAPAAPAATVIPQKPTEPVNVSPSVPDSTDVPAEQKSSTRSYAAMAKGALDKRPSPSAQTAARRTTNVSQASTSTQVSAHPPSEAPLASSSAPSFEPSAPAPQTTTSHIAPVRVPEGFGKTSVNFSFGDFSDNNTGSGTKFGSGTAAWDDSKKNADAANSAFINTLMSNANTTSTVSGLGSAPSVKEVESQLLSAAAAASTSNQAQAQEIAVEPPVMNTSVPSMPVSQVNPAAVNVPSVVPPQTAQPTSNPLMMSNNQAYNRMPPTTMPMGSTLMQNNKKGGRGGQAVGMAGGRGGIVGSNMRVPSYPMEYNYYEHQQGGYAVPFGQAPSFATDPQQMYSAAAQYGYNDMGFYAQQQAQQQQQQQSNSAPANAPPGLGGAMSASQTPSGEYSTSAGQTASDMPNSGSLSAGPQHGGQPQQSGYLAQPYSASYGPAGVSQQQGFMQQQGAQQQQLAGAGSVANTSQQEAAAAAYPGSHPGSFAGAASYAPPNLYPYQYNSHMYYPQYSAYPTGRYAGGFPQVQYQQPLPQDQARTAATSQYYGQAVTGGAGSTVGDSAGTARAGPPGYSAPSFGAQQQQQQQQHQQHQQQQQPANDGNWASQQESYQYRPSNYYQQANAGNSTAQEQWRRPQQ